MACNLDTDRLITIYNAADQVLHSRIQSFLLTQSIFVVAFVGWVATQQADQLYWKMGSLIVVCAILLCGIQVDKMQSIHKKLRHLNPILQNQCDEFKAFMAGGKDGYVTAFSRWTPLVIIGFWVLAGLLVFFG